MFSMGRFTPKKPDVRLDFPQRFPNKNGGPDGRHKTCLAHAYGPSPTPEATIGEGCAAYCVSSFPDKVSCFEALDAAGRSHSGRYRCARLLANVLPTAPRVCRVILPMWADEARP